MKTPWLIAGFSWYFLTGFSEKHDAIITRYGALADGITNNAAFIQKAIDEVAAAGGGRVIVPPGNFMTGTIFLKSGVDLHLEQGACLLGPHNRNEYTDSRMGLIEAKKQDHISISGPGIIDGQAHELLLDIFEKLRSGAIKTKDSIWMFKRPDEGERTLILSIDNCTDVHISGITLKNSSGWVQNYTECNRLDIEGITVQSTAYWNNDGLDVTDSKNVTIRNCFINSADDGICLKSGNQDFYCENILVDSCTIRSSASAFKLGTGSGGGFKNIKARNLVIFDTYRSAIAIECVDGGDLENINIQNVVARNTGNAIFIRRGHRNQNGRVGTLKGVYIAHVKVDVPLYKPDQGYPTEGPEDHLSPGKDKMPPRPSSYHRFGHPWLPFNIIPSSIVGIPGYPVEDVTLENIEITYGGRASKNIACIPLDSITSIPENAAKYPEFSMFGELPAWGLYVRHAEGIKMKNVIFKYLEDDFRPAMIFDDVKGVDINGVDIPTAKELPVVLFNHTSETSIKNLVMPVSEAKGVMKTNYK